MTAPLKCSFCDSTKSVQNCGLCSLSVCKSCVQYIPTNHFSFMAKVPANLQLANYCPSCFENEVAPALQSYDEMMEKAKECYFITKNYPGHVHAHRRHTKRVLITDCDDRRETILRLAFLAAELGFNSIIDAEVESAKTRKDNYQSSVWKGSALPANIDGARLERASLRGF